MCVCVYKLILLTILYHQFMPTFLLSATTDIPATRIPSSNLSSLSPLHFFICSPQAHHSSMESVELKVEMVGIHEKRLRKCLSKLKGIEKVEVDANSQKVVVTGYAHRNKVLKAVRRGGLKADFWSAQNELLTAYAGATATYGSFRFNNFAGFS